MQLNFLCRHHRRELMADPQAAGSLWLDSRRRLARDAAAPTPYRVSLAGSGLEAAAIHLRARPACDAEALRSYAYTALQLIDMLVRLRQGRLAATALACADRTMAQLADTSTDVDGARGAAEMLREEGRRLIQPILDTPVPASHAPSTLRPPTATLH